MDTKSICRNFHLMICGSFRKARIVYNVIALLLLLLAGCDKKEEPLPDTPESTDPTTDPRSEKAIKEFAFWRSENGGIDSDWGEIDNKELTVRIRVNVEKNIDIDFPDDFAKSLCPLIKISAGATISPGSKEPQDFTKPVKYTVTAADGSKSVYTVSVWLDKSYLENILSQLRELGYEGSETPARIPGLGLFSGDIAASWFELPDGVSYAGQIRGRSGTNSFYEVDPKLIIGDGLRVIVDIPLYFESGEPFMFELPSGLMIVPIYKYDEIEITTRKGTSGRKPDQKVPGGFENSKTGKEMDCFMKQSMGMDCDEQPPQPPEPKRDTRTQSGVKLQTQNQKGNDNMEETGRYNYGQLPTYDPSSRSAELRSASTIADAIDPSLDPKKIFILSLSLFCMNHDGNRSSVDVSYYPLMVSKSPLVNWYLKLFEGKEIDESANRERIQKILWTLTDGEYGKFSDSEMSFLKSLSGK